MPGPSAPVYIGGEEVLELWPCFPNLIPQVLCVSYAGKMYATFALDEAVVPRPEVRRAAVGWQVPSCAGNGGFTPSGGQRARRRSTGRRSLALVRRASTPLTMPPPPAQAISSYYLDELRSMADHFGVDPTDDSEPPRTAPPAAKKGGTLEMV